MNIVNPAVPFPSDAGLWDGNGYNLKVCCLRLETLAVSQESCWRQRPLVAPLGQETQHTTPKRGGAPGW